KCAASEISLPALHKRRGQMPKTRLLLTSIFGIKCVRSLLLLLCASSAYGCAAPVGDLVKSGRVEIAKTEQADRYVLKARVYEDENGPVLRVLVRPGNRSHVPRFYSWHMDVLVSAPDRGQMFDGVVPLGGKHQFFFYRMNTVLPEKSLVTLTNT